MLAGIREDVPRAPNWLAFRAAQGAHGALGILLFDTLAVRYGVNGVALVTAALTAPTVLSLLVSAQIGNLDHRRTVVASNLIATTATLLLFLGQAGSLVVLMALAFSWMAVMTAAAAHSTVSSYHICGNRRPVMQRLSGYSKMYRVGSSLIVLFLAAPAERFLGMAPLILVSAVASLASAIAMAPGAMYPERPPAEASDGSESSSGLFRVIVTGRVIRTMLLAVLAVGLGEGAMQTVVPVLPGLVGIGLGFLPWLLMASHGGEWVGGMILGRKLQARPFQVMGAGAVAFALVAAVTALALGSVTAFLVAIVTTAAFSVIGGPLLAGYRGASPANLAGAATVYMGVSSAGMLLGALAVAPVMHALGPAAVFGGLVGLAVVVGAIGLVLDRGDRAETVSASA